MAQQIFTTTGTWVCPDGVTSVQAEVWGGGGGGGGSTSTAASAGGGGGGYALLSLTVVSGTTYTVTVGTGGTGGNNGTGGTGGTSWFNTSGTVSATGGTGGATLTGSGGSGGAGANGSTNTTGGAGAARSSSTVSGGGGGAAAQGGNGGAASAVAVTGGTAGSQGTGSNEAGAGANGVSTNNTNGQTGNNYGGGGSGDRGASNVGGAGAPGVVVLTYTLPSLDVVQRTQGNSLTGSSTAAFGSNNTLNNTIVVIAFINANITNLGISDSQGNSYATVASNYNVTDVMGFEAWIAYGIKAGANTVTVTNGNNPTAIQVWELQGTASSSAIDGSAYAYQTAATSLSSGSASTTNATDALLAASVQLATGGTYSAGSGFIFLTTQTNATLTAAQEEKLVSSTGSYAGTFSLSSNLTYSLTVLLAISNTSIGGVTNHFLSTLGVGS